MKRRDFLKLGAAASVAPMLWLPRKAFAAATPGFGATKHFLVLYAKGGMRSHCAFNAVGTAPHVNPFGAEAAVAGRAWTLGSALVKRASGVAVPAPTYTASGGGTVTLPDFATAVSPDITVLGCIDHNPGGASVVDHKLGSAQVATGDPYGTDGLLARVGHDHPMYANGFSTSAVPPLEIAPTEFGQGAGAYAVTRPITLLSADGSFASNKPIGKGWKIQARAALDARFEATRSRAYRFRLDNFLVSKANACIFADMLKDPRLNITASANAGATDAGFTNQQLLDILGNYDLSTIGDTQSGLMSWGADVALALRFFGFGTPMAVVTREIYDMHDNEKTSYWPRVNDLGRQLHGLHYLLHQMPHPAGGTYWDHTVVMTLSEFSRNNTGADGFNSGAGSDHVPDDTQPNRNQAVAIMGGPIAASKGKLIGPTDSSIIATDPSQVFSTKQLLATIVDALGIQQDYFGGATPIQELYA